MIRQLNILLYRSVYIYKSVGRIIYTLIYITYFFYSQFSLLNKESSFIVHTCAMLHYVLRILEIMNIL